MFETHQEITKLPQKVILLYGIVDKILTSPIPKPINIKIIMPQQLTIQHSMQIPRMLQLLYSSCMYIKWTYKDS